MAKRVLIYSTIALSAVFFWLCMPLSAQAADSKTPVTVTANDADVSVSIEPIEKDGESYLFLPSGTREENIQYLDGNSSADYTTMTDENIGSLHFFSDDPETMGMSYINSSADHSAKAPGRVVLLDSDLNVEYEGKVEAIKGRGNTTWKHAQKKPYQIKLTDKANLLDPDDDSQNAKKWVLLANAFDDTLLRNQIALNMAKELGLESTPEGRQIDLYYDGEYLGVYYLCEKVEIGNGRVEINDLEKNPEVLTGGYLLEIDNAYYRDEDRYFSAYPVGNIVYKSPEMPSEEQAQYVEEIVREAFACIANKGVTKDGSKTLFDCIDKDAAVRYILIEEWIRNIDRYNSSAYLYKPESSDKLFFGPVWDCDSTMGKGGSSGGYDKWFSGGLGAMLNKSETFRQALQDEYASNARGLIFDTLLGNENGRYLKSFDDMAGQIETAAQMNQTVWSIRSADATDANCKENTAVLRDWIVHRAEWFDQTIMDDDYVKGKTVQGQTEISGAADNQGKTSAETFKKVKLVKPGRVKIKAKKKKLIVTWKKVKNATGYEIRYYRTGKTGAKVKVKRVSSTKITIKHLAKKKKYTVQVRAYNKQGTKLQYSNWSNKKTKRTR